MNQNHLKSKLLLAVLIFSLCSIINLQSRDLSKQKVKISALQTSIKKMFALFLTEYPELKKREAKILTNLKKYGYQLTDNEINKYNILIKEILLFPNYMHFAYNYSPFKTLENQLPKSSQTN